MILSARLQITVTMRVVPSSMMHAIATLVSLNSVMCPLQPILAIVSPPSGQKPSAPTRHP